MNRGGTTPEKTINLKWLNPAGAYLVGSLRKETGTLEILSTANKSAVVAFNAEGVWSATGGAPEWSDNFVEACVNAGYDVSSWEFKDTTISYREKLPYWDTCLQV